jgi:acetyl-CoA synthetase
VHFEPIRKTPRDLRVPPHLAEYARETASFSWDDARRELDGLPGGRGINIAYEAVDRHAAGPRGARDAIRWHPRRGAAQVWSYSALAALTSRFANLLGELGVRRGERVFSLLGRVPDLYAAALGSLKYGAVFCPLFSAFGPEPVRQRMGPGEARVLVTTDTLYRRKIEPLRATLPALAHVLLVRSDPSAPLPPATLDLRQRLEAADPRFEIPPTSPEDPALLHFTSGTTGAPKGALHVHEAVVMHSATGKLALDLHDEDVFWCTADPGWVTGTSYGIIAPLVRGVTMVVDESDFDAERWYGILQDERVSVWYTAPTAVRMLMRVGDQMPRKFDLTALRFVASVGEPLHAEAVLWGRDALGLPIHDNWWQTETGGILIANYAGMDIRPGSMGRPLPGIEAAIVRRRPDGGVDQIAEPDTQGELAIRAGWPSMFRTYLGQQERYERCFRDGWYLTGDLARRDADGYFWFAGRADDVIKSAGHLIGPTEVESVLQDHPAVAEAGVIGLPDPVAGEIVKAFVVTRAGHESGDALRRELLSHARQRLGPAVAPREIEFRPELPHTRSGKIMRRLLRARELGLPEGDLSTLEGVEA